MSSTSSKSIRDIHRQVASGLLELLQAHSSDLHTPNEWSIIFIVMEFAGAGLNVYEKQEDTPSSTPIAMETVATETGMQGGGVTMEPSDHSEHHSIDTDWVWVEETHFTQLILPNSFDLLSKEEPLPIHDPQVSNENMAHELWHMCIMLSLVLKLFNVHDKSGKGLVCDGT